MGTPNSSDRDDQMGAKIKTPKKSLGLQTKPKKNPLTKINPQKIPCQIPSHKKFQKALSDITRKIEKLVLNTQKILAKIFLPKKILKSKMSHPPKNPTITPVT